MWSAYSNLNQPRRRRRNISYKRRVNSSQEYADKLKHIIAESRSVIGAQNLTWVIANASYINGNVSPLVTNGQNLAVSQTANVMQGPNLDLVIGGNKRRSVSDAVGTENYLMQEPTHFRSNGLADAANSWATALIGPGKLLNSTSQPVTVASLGTAAQSLALSADGQTLVAPAGSAFRWVDEVSGRIDINQPISSLQTIGSGGGGVPGNAAASTTSGFRRAVVQNANGNFIITQAVPYPYNIVDDPQLPTDA